MAAAWSMMSPPIGLGTATVESGARGSTGTTGRTWPLAIRASIDNRPAAMIAEIKAKLAKGCLRNQDNVSTATIEISPYLIKVSSVHSNPSTLALRCRRRHASARTGQARRGARGHELLGIRPWKSRGTINFSFRDRSPLKGDRSPPIAQGSPGLDGLLACAGLEPSF